MYTPDLLRVSVDVSSQLLVFPDSVTNFLLGETLSNEPLRISSSPLVENRVHSFIRLCDARCGVYESAFSLYAVTGESTRL
jgi:hypothetical protein